MTNPSTQASRGEGIARWSVAKPVTVGMMLAGLVVLGVLAYSRIPVQLLPSGYELPFLYVAVPTLPANPSDTEDQIALPIEDMLSTARGISRLRTRVRTNEASFLIEFDDGTDMVEAYNQIRDRLERVWPALPSDVERYFIWKYNPNDQPIYWFGVSLGDQTKGEIRDHYDTIKTLLIRPLERVDGVSRVEIWGESERLIRIELDEAKVTAAGLSTYEIIEKLRGDNFVLSAGHIEDAQQKVTVRVMSRFLNLDDLRDLPIRPGWRLRDLTRSIDADFDLTTSFNRINGRDAVMVGVYKEADANTVEVCDAVRSLIHQQFQQETDLSRFSPHHFRSHGDLIQLAIQDLEQSAIWGGIFAVLTLLLFIRNVPMTLMIAMAIPLSMLITLVVMYFTDFTLNMLTLMGLMLSVGMVVDNAIVVVENVQRLRVEERLKAREAAIRGTAEVTLALIVSTATTVIVFLPMILMSGNQTLSFYLGKIGFPVCISLVASLVTSLIFIPLACVKLPIGKETPTPLFMRALEAAYRAGLRFVVRRRFDAALLFIAATATVVIPMKHVQRTDQLSGNLGDVNVRFDIESTVTLAERDAYFRTIEAALAPTHDALGIHSYRIRIGRDRDSKIQLFLKSAKEDTLPKEVLMERLAELIPPGPGITPKLSFQQRPGRGGGGGGDTDASITIQLRGPDTRKLQELSVEVTRRMRAIPHVQSVEVSQDNSTGADELHVFIDRELSQRQGLSATVIGSAVDYALRGRRLSDFHFPDRHIGMRVEGDPGVRQSLDKLRDVRLPAAINLDVGVASGAPSASGASTLVPLQLVTDDTPARGPNAIHRENRQTVLDIAIQTDSEDLEAMSAQIDAVMAGFALPRGYALDKGARFSQLKRNEQDQQFALALAIVFVFLLMGVLFESAAMPLAIVFSIPFAFVGVYWALYLTDTPLDIMAGVGLIILVGVVVNNGIVLVDVINQQREQGIPRDQAIVEGCVQRLRPVLMTALTTIFGLVPMATGDSGIAGIPYAPLGRTVIGGLLTSTLLTLFVVPFLYLLLDAAKTSIHAWITGKRA